MSDDDEYDQQQLFMRSMFANGEVDDNDDESEDDYISEHIWKCGDVTVFYHLAILAPGHGNSVWNSSECIAQHMLSSSDRSRLFGEKLEGKFNWPPQRALEFGAGAALPSLVLLKEGATKVICTDRKINEQTFDALNLSVQKNCEEWGISKEMISERISIVPHTWGEEIEKLTLVDGGGEIDLAIASDCIYNPTYHEVLLQSAAGVLSKENGIFIVGYSFHMNVPPERVLDFFDLASSKFGLEVVSELKKEYDGQRGIGDKDKNRGVVYIKVLAHKDTIYFR